MGCSGETIRAMAREIYGIELTEDRAAEIARQVTELAESAGRAGRGSDFDDELLSARQTLIRAAQDGQGS